MSNDTKHMDYIFDILRFISLKVEDKKSLLFGDGATDFILKRKSPLNDLLEEFLENYEYIISPDIVLNYEGVEVLEEMGAFIEDIIDIDNRHPLGKIFTNSAESLERFEWRLLRRLAILALAYFEQPLKPFSSDYEMIFAR